MLAGAAEAVAGGAEARHVAVLHELSHDRIEGPYIAEFELLAFHALGIAGLGVAADLDAAAGVDLRDPEGHHLAAQGGLLACRQDQAGVGHRQAQDGDQALELVIADDAGALEGRPGGRPQPREADRVRADAVALLQEPRVGDQPEGVETPVGQADQGADADVVAAGLHGTAEAVEAVEEVALAGVGRVHAPVGLVVVGLLEDLVGADAHGLEGAVAGVVERCGVDVHPADLAVALAGVVDRAHAFGHEGGVVLRVLAEDEDEALVPFLLQGDHLLDEFARGQGAPHRLVVVSAEAAVPAGVDAVVTDIEGGEQHDAVAVDAPLQLARRREDLRGQLRRLGPQQHGGLRHREGLLLEALGDDLAHLRGGRRRGLQEALDMRIINEVDGGLAQGHGRQRAHDAVLSLTGCVWRRW